MNVFLCNTQATRKTTNGHVIEISTVHTLSTSSAMLTRDQLRHLTWNINKNRLHDDGNIVHFVFIFVFIFLKARLISRGNL